jgi:serine/threonine protein kinase
MTSVSATPRAYRVIDSLHFSTPMAPEPKSRSEALQEAVAEIVDRMEAEGQTVIDVVCAARPELATAIRQRIERLAGMGLLHDHKPPPTSYPEKLGDFRLVSCLGGGGMGMVYLAVQESLGRQVALKVIRPESLYFAGVRDRFRREAEAVARLQHPGIVPLFMVGEDNGLPYFAMEYVRGASLEQILEHLKDRDPASLEIADLGRAIDACAGAAGPVQETARPELFGRSWVEACLRIARAVAEALAHAHARGVLHRDIKPSNVMLTRDGRVLLLDFGLAVLSGSTRLTRTGTQLGSFTYMSPEQVRGDAIDARSDVYSLGVTLYELLALRPPFREERVNALQLQILTATPDPVRLANRAVPWDAETVCLTAMEREPGRRYASVAALAQDLGNLLELRPITARRPGVVLRLKRFAQRRPGVAVALALGSLLVVGGPTGFLIQQRLANVAIQRALDGERREKARAQTNLDRSFQVLDQLVLQLSDQSLIHVPHMTLVRRDLLTKALGIYQEILRDDAGDPNAWLRTADAARRVGQIRHQLGDPQGALEALEQGLLLLAQCRSTAPDLKILALHEAVIWRVKAMVLEDTGRTAQAEALWRDALAVFQRLQREWPDSDQPQVPHAQVCNELGSLLDDTGRQEEAESLRRAAVTLLEQLSLKHSADAGIRGLLVSSLTNLGGMLAEHDRSKEAIVFLRRAETILEQQDAATPPPAMRSRALATIHASLGRALQSEQDLAGAEQHLVQALELVRTVVRDFPSVPEYSQGLVQTLLALGVLRKDRKDSTGALAVLGEAIAEARALSRRLPEAPDVTAVLAGALGEHADQCLLDGRAEDAVAGYTESTALLGRLVADHPQGVRYRTNLAYNLNQQAGIAADARDFAAARDLGRRALDVLAEARRPEPADTNVDDLTTTAARHLGGALYCLGGHEAMVRLVDELRSHGRDTREYAWRCGWLLTFAAQAVATDESLTEAEREAGVARHSDPALTFLERAQELGHRTAVADFLRSADCRVLRKNPRFASIARRQ